MKTFLEYIQKKQITACEKTDFEPVLQPAEGGSLNDKCNIEIYVDGRYIGTVKFFFNHLIETGVTINNLPNFIIWMYDHKKMYNLDGRKFKGNSSDLTSIAVCTQNNRLNMFQKVFHYEFKKKEYIKFISSTKTYNNNNYLEFNNDILNDFMEQEKIPSSLL